MSARRMIVVAGLATALCMVFVSPLVFAETPGPKPTATGLVMGSVVMPTEKPCARANVEFVNPLTTASMWVQADLSGKFKVSLPPGDYRVTAYGHEGMSPPMLITVRPNRMITVKIVVAYPK